MQWYWSPSKKGFFNDEDNVPACANPVPADAVAIADALRQQLLAGQCTGQQIVSDSGGNPILQAR